LLVISALTVMQYVSFAQTAHNEENAHMGRKQKNRNSSLNSSKLKVWLAAGFTTLCSVGASNVSGLAALLA
jgi:hypothetical protein